MQSDTPNNNDDSLPAQAPKRVRLTREKISQKEIDDVLARHRKIVGKASEVAREIIEIGGIIYGQRSRMRKGKWEPFVARSYEPQGLSMPTVQRYMLAFKKREALFEEGAAEFMSKIWGHKKPELEDSEGDTKGKNDASVVYPDAGGDDDDSQHGGPGFDPSFFPDKGQTAMDAFKTLVGTLDRQFFDSDDITVDAKLVFITELVNFLEARRKVFAARQESLKHNPPKG